MDYDESLFGDDVTTTGEIPIVVVDPEDDVEYEDVSFDEDPITAGKKPKKVKGVHVSDVPPVVVVDKWSAAEG